MFDPTSRYYDLDKATHMHRNGEAVRYVRRRFCPQGEPMPLLVEATVIDGDRLDLLTARALGDPLQFWRVCDANNALNPLDLMTEIGDSLRVPIPQA